MLFFPILVLVGLLAWVLHQITGGDFLRGFAQLVDRSQIVEGLSGYLAGRSTLIGEFRGRTVEVFLKRKRSRHVFGYLIVSMQTTSPTPVDAHRLSAYSRQDRDAELALFALEVKHEVQVTHEPYSLQVRWAPMGFFVFPGRFDPEKWRDVLASMQAVAGSLERRAA
jgi:hypothetical protein